MDVSRLRRETHIAQKQYLCDYCNTAIEKGEQYVKYVGVQGGLFVHPNKRFYVDRRHLKCTSEYLKDEKCEECSGGMSLPEMPGYLFCTC